jgi:hypothetical protein
MVIAVVFILGCEADLTRPISETKQLASADAGSVDLFAISGKVLKRAADHGFDRLSRPEQVFLCIWELEAEVNNGGFHQYYFNDGGDHAADAVEALETIGAARTAALVTRANRLFGLSGLSRDRNKRQQQLKALSETNRAAMEEIDGQFYRYEEDLTTLLSAFVSQNMGKAQVE